MENRDIVVVGATTKMFPEKEKFVPHNPLNRPKMNYVKPIIAFLVYIVLFALICFIPFEEFWINAIVLAIYTIVYMSVIAKRAIIWSVHLYQNLINQH